MWKEGSNLLIPFLGSRNKTQLTNGTSGQFGTGNIMSSHTYSSVMRVAQPLIRINKP